jgi:dTMP kinase
VSSRFITLEGIEGAGKTTVTSAIVAELQRRGLRVVTTREPGGTPLAERLRDIVLAPGEERISPVAETLLMFAARAVHLDNLIRPSLRAGSWVICDRFTDATRAYQGAGRGVDVDFIERLAAQVHEDLTPDLTLLLDLPVDQGLARVAARRGRGDRIERERTEFFERVRARYLELARAQPMRFVIVDASRDVAAVQSCVVAALQRLLVS